MRIALISDTHLAAAADAFNRNAELAVAAIGVMRPDLVVHLGDVTADGAHDPAQFAEAADRLRALPGPVLAVPGNHDVGDSPPAGGGKEPALDLASLAAFRQSFGADRWSLRAGGWLLLGLNAQVFGSNGEEEALQDAWLEGVLSDGREPVALFVHKPLFLDAPDDHPLHARYVPLAPRTRLLERLARRDLRLVASGHVHQQRVSQYGGTTHVWAPSTAFVIPDAIQETIGRKACGVALVELGEGEPRVSFERPPGLVDHNLLDHAEVYPQVAAVRRRG